MGRKNRTDDILTSTISVSLPMDCVIIVNKYTKEHDGNRSATISHIIRDWKRTVDSEKRERRERK
jgi:hypothetical protein